ncbi:Clr5 domain-containing protein [Xylariales sp. AK1849]|nr:Clr5 domain-containing protein [Xylariales sp. AK1849]
MLRNVNYDFPSGAILENIEGTSSAVPPALQDIGSQTNVTTPNQDDAPLFAEFLNLPDEWEERKEVIRQIYMTEPQSLKQLIHRMEKEHNFRRTEQQYRSRFKKWGWRKNNSLKKGLTVEKQAGRRRTDICFVILSRAATTPMKGSDLDHLITLLLSADVAVRVY